LQWIKKEVVIASSRKCRDISQRIRATPLKITLRRVVAVEIRTEDLPKTSLESYRYANLLCQSGDI
jgi:hypothetical protein